MALSGPRRPIIIIIIIPFDVHFYLTFFLFISLSIVNLVLEFLDLFLNLFAHFIYKCETKFLSHLSIDHVSLYLSLCPITYLTVCVFSRALSSVLSSTYSVLPDITILAGENHFWFEFSLKFAFCHQPRSGHRSSFRTTVASAHRTSIVKVCPLPSAHLLTGLQFVTHQIDARACTWADDLGARHLVPVHCVIKLSGVARWTNRTRCESSRTPDASWTASSDVNSREKPNHVATDGPSW